MRRRCYDTTTHDYENWGGRGIRVCARWLGSFQAFFSDVGNAPTKRHTLDRINNSADYKPGNVRWALSETQNNNRRDNRRFTYRGKTTTLAEHARDAGLSYFTVRRRVEVLKWTVDDALTAPLRVHNESRNVLITINGRTQSVMAWSRETGIGHATLLNRAHKGADAAQFLRPPRHGKPLD